MKMKEKIRIYMKNRASALFSDSIYDISIFYILPSASSESVYKRVYIGR